MERITENFEKYTTCTLRLHFLMAEGKGDGEEADELREELDDVHGLLTGPIADVAENLSGDLYMLSDEDMYIMTTTAEKKALKTELKRAIRYKKWLRVLEILRYSLNLPRDYIAMVRGIVWMNFNTTVSRAFLEYSLRIREIPDA